MPSAEFYAYRTGLAPAKYDYRPTASELRRLRTEEQAEVLAEVVADPYPEEPAPRRRLFRLSRA